jgi:hypothetical protein
LKTKYNRFKVEHAKIDAKLKAKQSETSEYEREVSDISERYGLINELKDKIMVENEYLQKQNTHLIRENQLLNKETLHR